MGQFIYIIVVVLLVAGAIYSATWEMSRLNAVDQLKKDVEEHRTEIEKLKRELDELKRNR